MTLLKTKIFIVLLLLVSISTSNTIMASVDDHDHEHKDHHSSEQKKQDKEDHHKHTDHHEHNDFESHSDDEDDHHDDHRDHDSHDGHDEHSEEETKVHLDQKTMDEFDIRVDTAKSGWIKKTKLFPGEIAIHLDYLAHVTPRFPGVVKKIYRHIGEDVKKGDVLAVIESNDSLTPYKIT